MRPRRAGYPAILALVLTSCSGQVATSGGSSSGGGGSSVSASGTAVTTAVQYGGTYTEELEYTTSSPTDPTDVQTIDKVITFSFRESVSLVTPKSALLGKPFTTSAVSSSINRPVYFYDQGTVTYTETPDPSHNTCTATLTGKGGTDWTQTSAQPPVQIVIAAVTPNDTLTKDYRLQVTAVLPTSGAQQNITSSATNPTGECGDQRYLSNPDTSPALFKNPQYNGVLWAGPNAPPWLVLPLETQNYTKQYSVHQTVPYSFSGAIGTDKVDADTTLTVNDTAHLYAALGDSFSSGAINPVVEPGGCLRSVNAYPRVYDSKGLVFLACSGASTLQITAQQVPGIPPNAQVVSLTSGGDDFTFQNGEGAQGLFAILFDCAAYNYARILNLALPALNLIPCQLTSVINNLDSQLPAIQGNIEALIAAIHRQAEQARIYVLGYSDPFPDTAASFSCPGLETLQVGTLPVPLPGLSTADFGFMSGVIVKLNQTIQEAVSSSGTATYVPPFTGHDVCTDQSWFVPLAISTVGQPLHPNTSGQAAMAESLLAVAGAPPA